MASDRHAARSRRCGSVALGDGTRAMLLGVTDFASWLRTQGNRAM